VAYFLGPPCTDFAARVRAQLAWIARNSDEVGIRWQCMSGRCPHRQSFKSPSFCFFSVSVVRCADSVIYEFFSQNSSSLCDVLFTRTVVIVCSHLVIVLFSLKTGRLYTLFHCTRRKQIAKDCVKMSDTFAFGRFSNFTCVKCQYIFMCVFWGRHFACKLSSVTGLH